MPKYLFLYWSSNVNARNECHRERKENSILQPLLYWRALNQSCFWHLYYTGNVNYNKNKERICSSPQCISPFSNISFLWHAMMQSVKYLCFTLMLAFLLLVTTLLNGKDNSLEERPREAPGSRNSLQDSRSLLDTSLLSAPPPIQNNQLYR